MYLSMSYLCCFPCKSVVYYKNNLSFVSSNIKPVFITSRESFLWTYLIPLISSKQRACLQMQYRLLNSSR